MNDEKSAARLLLRATKELGDVSREYSSVVDAVNDTQRLRALVQMEKEIRNIGETIERVRELVAKARELVGTGEEVGI